MKINRFLRCAVVVGLTCVSLNSTLYGRDYRDTSLSPHERAEDLLSRLTLDEKIALMMDASPGIEHLGVPAYNWWNEALHGVGRAGLATVFPQAIGLAATFDDEAVKNTFDAVSTEARAKYNEFRKNRDYSRYKGLTFWTPNVNIFRDPRWGRGQETYGEDPYLTTVMGAAVVRGLQGPSDSKYIKTIAGAKHFAVHSGPEWNRHSYDAHDIDSRDLWETYLPAFHRLVKEGVGQVMCAYNRFEGEPCCGSKRLLTQILRNKWGYDGIIVTDCWAMCDFYNEGAHATHPSGVEASADAVYSGTDLECGPVFANLHEALNRGLIDEASINQSVLRLLTARFSLGEIDDDPESPWAKIGADVIDSESHRHLALDMARKSMVLLKNNGILPLSSSGTSLIVMGPNAVDSVMQWGNYNGTPSHTVTVLDGIRNRIANVPYLRACDHVVNKNIVSCYNNIYGDDKVGLKAVFWNTTKPIGEPVASFRYSSAVDLNTGGATVFAPGVNLTDFSAKFTGIFKPDATGEYIINMKADNGVQIVKINGKQVIKGWGEGFLHDNSYTFHAEKGKNYDIELFYSHGEGLAQLKFDIGRAEDYVTDAGDADIVIFVGGISPAFEGEEMPVELDGFKGGDRTSIELPKIQRELLAKLKEEGKKIVFVNFSGSAMGLAPEDSICDAILQAWYPGQAGGEAVAEVLFGEYNPAGRLPVTFYRDDSQLPDFEDYDMAGRTYRFMDQKPLYAFGYGLSYTKFDYVSASLGASRVSPGESVDINVKLCNTGNCDGEEVVQVYVRRIGDTSGPKKSLKAFKRIAVPKGESREVRLTLDPVAFESYDAESDSMKVFPGEYEILYGGSSDNLKLLPLTLSI